jgi:hypothetical protein
MLLKRCITLVVVGSILIFATLLPLFSVAATIPVEQSHSRLSIRDPKTRIVHVIKTLKRMIAMGNRVYYDMDAAVKALLECTRKRYEEVGVQVSSDQHPRVTVSW